MMALGDEKRLKRQPTLVYGSSRDDLQSTGGCVQFHGHFTLGLAAISRA